MSSMTNASHPDLKLAVQTLLLPGNSLEEKFEAARRFGFDAVEVCVGPDFDLGQQFDAVRKVSENSGVPVAAICTHPIHDPMEGDSAEHSRRVDALVDLINRADALGASGVVSVPVRSRTALESAPSRVDALEAMSNSVVEVMQDVSNRLDDGTASLFLEPLNRYEAWFLNGVGHASDLARKVGHPRVKALADIFHMNIEEASFSEPVLNAGELLGHVHVADNNRLEPGAGCLDFRGFFEALKRIQYSGYVSIECFSATGPKLSGPHDQALPASAQYMRSIWESLES